MFSYGQLAHSIVFVAYSRFALYDVYDTGRSDMSLFYGRDNCNRILLPVMSDGEETCIYNCRRQQCNPSCLGWAEVNFPDDFKWCQIICMPADHEERITISYECDPTYCNGKIQRQCETKIVPYGAPVPPDQQKAEDGITVGQFLQGLVIRRSYAVISDDEACQLDQEVFNERYTGANDVLVKDDKYGWNNFPCRQHSFCKIYCINTQRKETIGEITQSTLENRNMTIIDRINWAQNTYNFIRVTLIIRFTFMSFFFVVLMIETAVLTVLHKKMLIARTEET